MADELEKAQKEMLKDHEVIHFLTTLNHLELRVKNVAITKLFKIHTQAKQSDTKQSLSTLITSVRKA